MKHDTTHLTGQPYWHPLVHPEANRNRSCGKHTLGTNWTLRALSISNPFRDNFRVNIHGGAFA